jgi:YidC/Oxa1 family membrane protein insertase
VMESFGINLAESAQKALREGYSSGLPYILLVLAVTATSFIQQKQVSGRNTATPVNPQQQMLMRIMPLFFAFISFTLPAGIVVYFLVSNLFRVGQQALITRTMYRDSDAPVATTGRETAKSSIKTDESAAKSKGFFAQIKEIGLPNPAEAKRDVQTTKGAETSANGSAKTKSGASSSKSSGSATSASSSTSGPSRAAPSAANRSKNKKKRK